MSEGAVYVIGTPCFIIIHIAHSNSTRSAHNALQMFICARGDTMFLPKHPSQALEDKTVLAMAISMFAVGNIADG